jgi:hypothetical protein
VTGGGEPGHVGADLGEDFLRAGDADAGDLIELTHLGGERGDGVLDPGGELVDLGGEGVDAGEHHGQQERVVIGEVPGQRRAQDGGFAEYGPWRTGRTPCADLRIS